MVASTEFKSSDIDESLQILGNREAKDILILAHGAGAGSNHSFLAQMAELIASQDVLVVRFDFPYMQLIVNTGKRRPPDRMPRLEEAYIKVIEAVTQRFSIKENGRKKLFIGGKSMGGRVATLIAQQPSLASLMRGVIVLGFPFHPPSRPDNFRGDHLNKVLLPHLILQGERDPFGNMQEIGSESFDHRVSLRWLKDGEHSFIPRKSSGITQSDNLKSAAVEIVGFVQSCGKI